MTTSTGFFFFFNPAFDGEAWWLTKSAYLPRVHANIWIKRICRPYPQILCISLRSFPPIASLVYLSGQCWILVLQLTLWEEIRSPATTETIRLVTTTTFHLSASTLPAGNSSSEPIDWGLSRKQQQSSSSLWSFISAFFCPCESPELPRLPPPVRLSPP